MKINFFLGVLVIFSSCSSFGQSVLEYSGSFGGEMSDLEVYPIDGRTFTYVAQGNTLVVYETTDPRNIQERNRISPASGKIHDMALGNRFLAVALGSHGTWIYSLENPIELELASKIAISSKIVKASGSAILAEGGKAGSSPSSGEHYIWAYSIHDPFHPVEIFFLLTGGYQTYMIPAFYKNHSTLYTENSIFYRYYPFPKELNGHKGFFRVAIENDHFDETYIDLSIPNLYPFDRNHKVFFHEDWVFAGTTDRLTIDDISGNPSERIYDYPMLVDGKMWIDKGTAYVKSVTDYFIFDVTDQSQIQFKGRILFPYEPIAIVDQVAYSIDSGKQLVLQNIEGFTVKDIHKAENSLGNVFCIASSQDTFFTSTFYSDGTKYVTEVHILTGSVGDWIPLNRIILDGYFPFLYAQNEWLLVDNSTKLRLYNMEDPQNPQLVWTMDPDYPFPPSTSREPSFDKNYDLLFEYPYIILSYNRTFQVYEIVDRHTVIHSLERTLDRRLTALYFHDGFLFGLESERGLAVFEGEQPGFPRIFEDHLFQDIKYPQPYGRLVAMNQALFMINYSSHDFNLYHYDATDFQFLRHFYPSEVSAHDFYWMASDGQSLYLLSSRNYHYAFNAQPTEQKLYQIGFDDPSNPTLIASFSLSPTLEPPIAILDDSLLIPGCEAGIIVFKCPAGSSSVTEWMLLDCMR